MSGQHTPGRLVAYGLVLRGDPDGVTDESQVAGATTPEDALRLAACWNYFENVETKDVEQIVADGGAMYVMAEIRRSIATVDALHEEFRSMLQELAAARALLGEVRAEIGPGLMERIRSYLEAK